MLRIQDAVVVVVVVVVVVIVVVVVSLVSALGLGILGGGGGGFVVVCWFCLCVSMFVSCQTDTQANRETNPKNNKTTSEQNQSLLEPEVQRQGPGGLSAHGAVSG